MSGQQLDPHQKRRLENRRYNEQVKLGANILGTAGLTGVGAWAITPYIQQNAYRPSAFVLILGFVAISVAVLLLDGLRSEE